MALIKKASEVVDLLDLKPHPEGGYFSETFRDSSITLSISQLPPQYKVGRPVSTSIYFLLPSGSISRLHRIPCAETWHFYMGEPLTVFELHDDGHIELTVLGTDLDAGHHPQYTVPANVWFGSFPTLDVASFSSDGSLLVRAPKRDAEFHYSLVGCTCAPAFQFEDFQMAELSDVVLLAPKAEPFLRCVKLDLGHRPQYTVPANVWFGSFPTLDVASFSSDGSLLVRAPKRDAEFHYSLVGCTCAPAFQFEDFKMAELSDVVLLAPKAEPFLRYLTNTGLN